MGRAASAGIIVALQPTECPMPQPNDLSRSLAALDQDSTLIAVIEMSQASWLVGAIVPGVERHPLKKLVPDAEELLRVLQRWRDEATKTGRTIARIAVAYEAGRDGFWLARWLRAHGIEAHVIHASSVAVSREHRRAKTDRLDINLLKRAFLGWLRGERGHCTMAAIPTLEAERRPAAEPGARGAGRGTHPHHQPHQECVGATGHPKLQAAFAQSIGTLGGVANPRRGGIAAQHPG